MSKKEETEGTAQTGPYGWAILLGLNRTGKRMYEGTASPWKVAKNRAANKAGRVARRRGRR